MSDERYEDRDDSYTDLDDGSSEIDPRQDPRLRARISAAIADAATDYFQNVLNKEVPSELLAILDYESALGAYILDQNPYAEVDDLERPTIPDNPLAETRWIRKSGVLRNFHAFTPLPATQTIPAGEVLQFMHEDWAHLAETASWTETAPGPKPPIPPAIPPDHTEIYSHRVVKFVRFRYTVKDRKQPGDAQAAYFIVAYSGGDH
jgi:hypothetical protein